MIKKIKGYIQTNQTSLDRIKNYHPKNDRWIGTIDYATARFNTLILHLVNYPLSLDEYREQMEDAQRAIENFIKEVDRYYRWPSFLRWWPAFCVFWVGRTQIPRVKKLLNMINAE